MMLSFEAACGCSIGKIRRNNEDNFCFAGHCLDAANTGLDHPRIQQGRLKNGLVFGVFDGMGGENFGELAAYAAAGQLLDSRRKLEDFFLSDADYCTQLMLKLNDAVVAEKRKMFTEQMGTTGVLLYFRRKKMYLCNLGDSRGYRYRSGALEQLSVDHVAHRSGRKAPLTQYLGIDPEEMLLEPSIAADEPEPGDVYLLCSDGLTDMLTDAEIADLLHTNPVAENCVQALICAALDRGGRDNITVIICKIT